MSLRRRRSSRARCRGVGEGQARQVRAARDRARLPVRPAADPGRPDLLQGVRGRHRRTPGESVTTPEALHAFYLTVLIAAIAVPLNTIFGIACALVLVRQKFRGKAILNGLIDLPFAVSPVVIGLSLVLVYGSVDGWFGPWLLENGIRVIFSVPGMVLATIFVSLPFVVREVAPVLQEIGDDQEQAASTLGANGVADVLADHPAGDPLGRHLRRRPGDRAGDRRVRRRRRRLGQDRGQDRDRDPAGREPVRALRRRWRLRGSARARGDGADGAARHEPDPAARQAGEIPDPDRRWRRGCPLD